MREASQQCFSHLLSQRREISQQTKVFDTQQFISVSCHARQDYAQTGCDRRIAWGCSLVALGLHRVHAGAGILSGTDLATHAARRSCIAEQAGR